MRASKQILTVFGVIMLAIGILGFVPGVSTGATGTGLLLGIFAINPLHNLIHVATGVLALVAGMYGEGAYTRLYGGVFGVVYALITVIGFTQILFVGGSLLGLVPINTADNFLHLGITAVALGIFAGARAKVPAAAR